MLFQGFNKRMHREGKRADGSEVGVYLDPRKKYWVASIRIYTPEEKTQSIGADFYFSIKDLTNQGALNQANAFRKKYTLLDGMNFETETVPPTKKRKRRDDEDIPVADIADEGDEIVPDLRPDKHNQFFRGDLVAARNI